MKRERLSPDRIRKFTCPQDKSQAFLWDSEAPRLAVRATSGAKAFVFESKLNRKTIRVTIGSVEDWPLGSVWSGKGAERQEVQRGAREEANRLAALVDQGIDPRDDRTARQAAAQAARAEADRRDATVGEAWTAYIEDRRSHLGKRYHSDHVNLARPGGERKKRGKGETTPGPLAPLMGLRLAEVGPERIRPWLQVEAGARATQTRQAFGAFRTFLAWCEDRPEYRGLADPDAFTRRIARQVLPKKPPRMTCSNVSSCRPGSRPCASSATR
jgi:hypothetical protein